MGGRGNNRISTALMDASVTRQEEAIRRQEEAVARREEEIRRQEEATRREQDATRRARGARGGGARAVLLGASEAGTIDQPLPAGLRRVLGG